MTQRNKPIFVLLMICILASCQTSRISGNGSSSGAGSGGVGEDNVAFNPTTTSDLQIYNYKALRQRFIGTFGLSASSDTIIALDAKQNAFKGIKYTSTFAKEYASVVAVACGEIGDSVAFPEGKSIDHLWKLLNESSPTQEVKDVEAKILEETAGQTDDVVTYGLCFTAFTLPGSVFINYTHTESSL